MSNSSAGNLAYEHLIENAGVKNKDSLNLSNFSLTEIPPEVFKLTSLRGLLLANNQITRLPPDFLKLENLVTLDLTENPVDIPSDILERRGAREILEFYAKKHGFGIEHKIQPESQPINAVNPPANPKVNGSPARVENKKEQKTSAADKPENNVAAAAAPNQVEKIGIFRRFINAIKNFLISLPFIGKADTEAVVDFNIDPRRMELQDRAKFWEAEYGPFPRPITEQHLSSYAAWRRISTELGLTATVVFRTVGCLILWTVMGYFLSLLLVFAVGERWAVFWSRAYLFVIVVWYVAGLLPIMAIALLDGAFTLWRPFYTFAQRETYGTSKWLMPKQLHRSHKWLFRHQETIPNFKSPFDYLLYNAIYFLRKIYIGYIPADPLKHNMFPVAPFGFGTWICYPLAQFARHIILFGTPGSGKSDSFVMSYVRSAASLGAAFVMDIKGEMFKHCGHYYKRKFRLDFEESHKSDRFLMGRMLRRDYDFARTVAQSITGYDPDRGDSGNSQFFRSNAAQLLAALLLHLSEINPDFSPGDIFDFLTRFPASKEEGGLIDELLASPNPDVGQIIAGMPVRAAETFDGILSNMTEGLQSFKDPHVMKVFSPPTAAEIEKGCKIFDPFLLRLKGTACFMVVTEGKAKRIGNVLGTVVNITYNVLRKTGTPEDCQTYLPQHAIRMLSPAQVAEFTADFKQELARARGCALDELSTKLPSNEYALLLGSALTDNYLKTLEAEEAATKPCFSFFIVDEAGNVSLTGLREKTGVGRAFRAAFILIYHNTAQMAVQFGKDYADAVKGTVGTRIFLPGLEGDTAKYASTLMRRTTVLQSSGTDAKNDNFDSTRLQETARELMTEDEVRTLLEYKQAVMVAFALSPLRIAFPHQQTLYDTKKTPATEFSSPLTPPGLSDEIDQYQKTANRAKIQSDSSASSVEAAAGVGGTNSNGGSPLKLPTASKSVYEQPAAASMENSSSAGDEAENEVYEDAATRNDNSIRLAAQNAEAVGNFFKESENAAVEKKRKNLNVVK